MMHSKVLTWRPLSSRRIPAIVLLAALVVFSGCSDNSGGKKKGGDSARKKAVPVTIGVSAIKAVPVELRAVGTVEPFATVAIKSQIMGIVQSVHFQEGDEVKQGQVLFTIDPRPFRALLDQAQGALARDRAELANARKELERYAQAAQKGYVSTEQAEQAQTKAATLTATVKADEAAVENARLQLEYCSIISPITGRTGELLADRGNLIKANADTSMVTINQISPIKVSFTVPGTNVGEIKKYQAAGSLQVLIPVSGGEPLAGTFSFLDNSVDPATGTIRLKAEFANTGKTLWPGEFVEVRLILTERQNTVVVPTAAIQIGQTGAYVYVVRPDLTVEDRPVATGAILGDETVIESGIQAGERVVTDGQMQLTDGVTVEERDKQSITSAPEAAGTGKEKARGKR
jgi:multidrug efflux system membrane fusion protein